MPSVPSSETPEIVMGYNFENGGKGAYEIFVRGLLAAGGMSPEDASKAEIEPFEGCCDHVKYAWNAVADVLVGMAIEAATEVSNDAWQEAYDRLKRSIAKTN